MALNDKQRMFALEWMVDMNATQAAIRSGYSKKTAYSQGQRLLKHVEVQALIEELMAQKEAELIMESDEVLKRLTRIARRQENENSVVVVKERKDEWVNVGGDGAPSWKKQTIETEEAMVVEYPAKLSDVNKSLELLGKVHGVFKERQVIDMNQMVVFANEDELED